MRGLQSVFLKQELAGGQGRECSIGERCEWCEVQSYEQERAESISKLASELQTAGSGVKCLADRPKLSSSVYTV